MPSFLHRQNGHIWIETGNVDSSWYFVCNQFHSHRQPKYLQHFDDSNASHLTKQGSLTSNFKVIHQGHVNYFSIFGFYDLNFVENDTNLITLSYLHQKISRLTNNGKNSVFWPPSCTYDVMTNVTWQRQDDVTYVKMCLPSLVTDTLRRFLRLESSKKLQGKNARGVASTPPWASEG